MGEGFWTNLSRRVYVSSGLLVPPEQDRVAVRLQYGGANASRGARFKIDFGSGPGIRTLNLAVNRSLRPVQKYGSDLTECR
jgi:hypothetical protein